jgi:hypothetical protein
MASLSATLTEFADNGNSRTYTSAGHTASKPKLVVEKRTVPVGNQTIADFSVTVTQAVNGADGGIAPQKVSAEIKARYPTLDADSSDLATIQAAVLVLIRDVVASDEFGASFTTQNWVE